MKAVPDIADDHGGRSESGHLHAGRGGRSESGHLHAGRAAASGEVAAFAIDAVDAELEAGLATARRVHGWTYVALPAPVVAAPAVVAAARSAALVAWSSQSLTLVGIGVARELRGSGAERWRDVIEAAHGLGDGVVVGGAGRESLVKPRLLGGVAFAPGAADAAPWTGFGDAWFMLPRWTYVHDGARGALVLAVDARDAQQGARWHSELQALRTALAAPFAQRAQPPMTSIDPGDRDAWRMQVRAITDAIANGECAKVVSARSAVVTLAGEARAADMLAELDARHPECVRVVVRPPGGGTFIAATPERLVRREGATVACDALAGSVARGATFAADALDSSVTRGATFEGDSLDDSTARGTTFPADAHAGSMARGSALAADAHAGSAHVDDGATELLASGKDRREHDLVVSAIGSALRELGADVRIPAEPAIRRLRHVLHLHTPIAATLREPLHVLELAAALHPTPAVGGTPTRIATEWIAARESVPRGWYASPVGWFDLEGNGELAVAIRSGLVTGDRAHLWAGAGIVAGSDPDRELDETDLKLRAILGALGVSA